MLLYGYSCSTFCFKCVSTSFKIYIREIFQTLEQQLESLSQEASEIEAAVEEKQKQRPTLSRRLLAAENKLSELKKIKDKKIEEATETVSPQLHF